MSSSPTERVAKATPPHVANRIRGLSDRGIAWVFVSPTIFLLLAINIFPLFWTIYLSFTNFQTGRERLFTAEELMRLPDGEQILHIDGVGFVHCKKARQNMLAPYCHEIGDNPLEGGRLPPDPRVTLPVPDGGAQ